MSISSLTPAAAIAGAIGFTATAGSFCLFCENGVGGLLLVTSVSLPFAVAPAIAASPSDAVASAQSARSLRMYPLL